MFEGDLLQVRKDPSFLEIKELGDGQITGDRSKL